MKEYTLKQIKELKANPYTLNVTKNKLYFTCKFKEDFWISYQAGNAPRKILKDFGYNLDYFGQKQIDDIVQRIKHQALSGNGFTEGENRQKRVPETTGTLFLHSGIKAYPPINSRIMEVAGISRSLTGVK